MGQPLPDFIANAPELKKGLGLYLQAFFDLDTERSHAHGITMIPWSRIKEYAEFNNFSDEQADDLFYLIRQMDVAHTNNLRKQHASKSERLSKNAGKKG